MVLIFLANSSCIQSTQTKEPDPVVNIYIVGPNGLQPAEEFTVTADKPVTGGCTCEGVPAKLIIKIHANGGNPPYTLAEYPGMPGDSFTIPIDNNTDSITLTVQSSDGKSDDVTVEIPSCPPPPNCPVANEICMNNIDDDGDGQVDENCAEICDNHIDDDGDNKIDEGCQGGPTKENCGNNKDDDGDGQVDEGCSSGRSEVCGNGIDDDGDGQVDEGCPQPPKKEICGNGIDDDNDGKTDSADPDCPPDPPDKFQCDDGKDNDADGLIDLADPQCKNRPDNNESE